MPTPSPIIVASVEDTSGTSATCPSSWMTDNEAAAALLHPEVGKFVALGGGDHLLEANERIKRVASMEGEGDAAGARVLRGYGDLVPQAPARGNGRKRRAAATKERQRR